MILIVCLDDKNGMMFNKRRQSRDAAVTADIVTEVGDGILWMNEYSSKLFINVEMNNCEIRIDEDFLDSASQGEYCFLEGKGASDVNDRIEKLIIYKWNRLYPSDVSFDIPLDGWKQEKICEFAGNSHEKITKEVYVK